MNISEIKNFVQWFENIVYRYFYFSYGGHFVWRSKTIRLIFEGGRHYMKYSCQIILY